MGLESLSRAPKRKRASAAFWHQVELIVAIRKEHPRLSKHKIAVIPARDHGITLSIMMPSC
ncbi:MAG: helix-turn-helix domain-containing protein [Actinobacteria bacterium]|nr:helix-turn-helix domain-containing protein [Actinomycetota bacterium]